MNESNAVVVYDKIADPLAAIKQIGTMYAKSGMFGCTKVEEGEVLALATLCERKSPIDIKRTYHLMFGSLCMRADAMLARFKALGGECKWLSDLGDVKQAKAHFKYKENELDAAYTIEDAKREQLLGKDLWKKSTPDMLRARLISKVLRMIAPEIVAGVYTPEEQGDDAPTVTAPPLFSQPATSPKSPTKEAIDAEIVKPLKATEQDVSAPEAPAVNSALPLTAQTNNAATTAESGEREAAQFPPEKFLEIIKGREADVLAWAKAKDKFEGGETIAHLKRSIVLAAIENPERLWRAVDGNKKAA